MRRTVLTGAVVMSVASATLVFAQSPVPSPVPVAPAAPGSGVTFSASGSTSTSASASAWGGMPMGQGYSWWYYAWVYRTDAQRPILQPENKHSYNLPNNEHAHVRRIRALPRPSSSVQRERAKKYLAAGDELFISGRFVQAVERYRMAARAATDQAEPHMLQGLALVAQGNYTGALVAFRRALELQSDWTESALSLDDVYSAPNLKVVTDRLSDELARTPLKPDLLLALGMQLYFSGERDRAATYLSQAASLKALDPDLLEPFLAQPKLVQQAEAESQSE